MLKCKLWRPDDYSEAPPALPITWSKWNDDIRVLGVPFGTSTSYLHTLQSKLHSVWNILPHLSDAQVSFTPLRVCLGCCKVNHILRGRAFSYNDPWLQALSAGLHSTFQAILGSAVPIQAWKQATLPIRLGGMGLYDPITIAPFAYLSSVIGVALKPLFDHSLSIDTIGDIWKLIDIACSFLPRPTEGAAEVPLSSWVRCGHIDLAPIEQARNWASQKWWGHAMALASKRELIDVSSVRDGHRLLCLSSPLNGAWLSCIRDAEFRSLVKYRLWPANPTSSHTTA